MLLKLKRIEMMGNVKLLLEMMKKCQLLVRILRQKTRINSHQKLCFYHNCFVKRSGETTTNYYLHFI